MFVFLSCFLLNIFSYFSHFSCAQYIGVAVCTILLLLTQSGRFKYYIQHPFLEDADSRSYILARKQMQSVGCGRVFPLHVLKAYGEASV